METLTDFIFLGPKITVNRDYSHEIQRCFLLGRKAMINLDSILKSRMYNSIPEKQPNQKVEKRAKQTFLQRRHTDS